MNIRQINLVDLPVLQRLGKQTFQETFASQNREADMQAYLVEKFSTEQLIQELNNPHMTFYFAEIAGQAVGYLKLNFAQAQTELQDQSAVEIERIYVLANHHRQGVEQALFQHALLIANQHNANYIWLGVWEHNHKALRFYEKNGFVAFDRHIFRLGSDEQVDIMMKKVLK
ncbi:GNAT family N-acetyltransferase [Rodentibacter haemolyticus]|uniref:GNAT family N-acetyltransferase n=1 Tax=Rodentibacter haemolyticus TaxID=2778911 RepID=A0ABX6UXD6_9PAST|nr:GNAT family N-acetyltransferase [Rodentibacter haemolyticus]QPB42767.1 GNAT family N-acetyltransferase [Rodentibacter haemolyticus]